MEEASQLLAVGVYLDAATHCRSALLVARQQSDFNRMKRICLPLLESQRYLRQDALDTGLVHTITKSSDIPSDLKAGCYLFAPNFVGADTKRFRAAANDAGIGVFVLTREPTTSKNKWPIVSVAQRVVRIQIDPPPDDSPTPNWFSATAEALGDQAILDAKSISQPDDPKPWIVDDFLEYLDACPEHEKFIKSLADACDDAINAPPPPTKRRRALIDDPYSF